MQADESYAGSRSFYRFEAVVRTHGVHAHHPDAQGRAAERILFHTILKPGGHRPEQQPLRHDEGECRGRGRRRRATSSSTRACARTDPPFQGDVNLEALERLLAEHGDRVPLVMVTVHEQLGRRQPVSMEEPAGPCGPICDRYRKPFSWTPCRFAENACSSSSAKRATRTRPQGSPQEMFSLARGATMSAKKDGLAKNRRVPGHEPRRVGREVGATS